MQVELNSYQDIGSYLREVREGVHYNVRDIAQAINIRAKYLEALEEGDLTTIPGKVYARGYLQHYAEFLGIDKHAIAIAFDRVGNENAQTRYFLPEPSEQNFQPGIVVLAVAFALIGGIYGYWYHTHKDIILPPELKSVAPVPTNLLDPIKHLQGVPENDDDYIGITSGESGSSTTHPVASGEPLEESAKSVPETMKMPVVESPKITAPVQKPILAIPTPANPIDSPRYNREPHHHRSPKRVYVYSSPKRKTQPQQMPSLAHPAPVYHPDYPWLDRR